MDVLPVRVEEYILPDGRSPFSEWVESLEDGKTRRKVADRLRRLRLGNFGDCKFFETILELRIDYGPGYRIYCGKKNNTFVLLLVRGTKRSQDGDIKTAKKYWAEYEKGISG